jgi:hypothetical protein
VKWNRFRIVAVLRTVQVVIPKPLHIRLGEEILTASESLIGRRFEISVVVPVDQYRSPEYRSTVIAEDKSRRKREIGSGGIAADQESIRVYAERGGVFADQAHCRNTILKRRGKLMLGGEPVPNTDNPKAAVIGETPAQSVMCCYTPHHEAAAMEVDQTRETGRRCRDHRDGWEFCPQGH